MHVGRDAYDAYGIVERGRDTGNVRTVPEIISIRQSAVHAVPRDRHVKIWVGELDARVHDEENNTGP